MKKSSRSSGKCKRGRPKVALSQRALQCPCGGASGRSVCKYAVFCLGCNLCKVGCKKNPNCDIEHVEEVVESVTLREKEIVHNYKEDKIASEEQFARKRQKEQELVSHRDLSLDTATVTNLAKAYGRNRFNIPNASLTIDTLQERINADEEEPVETLRKTDHSFLRKYFLPIRIVLDAAIKIFAGGEAETSELKNLFINEKSSA